MMAMGILSKRKLGRGGQRTTDRGEKKEQEVKRKKVRLMRQDDLEESQKKKTVESRGDGGERDESYEQDDEDETEEEDDDEEEEEGSSGSESEQDIDDMQKGTAKLHQGSRAFKMAFTKIMKKSSQDESVLGPVLSAHKKLVVKKLAEEVEDFKAKGDAKKARNTAGEKGRVTPAGLLDSKEKFLISVATKGVVKLFNAVNKAQNPLKRMNPSRAKDAKVLAKKRREAFYSEMKKTTTTESTNSNRVPKATDSDDEGEPGWAPLRDSYMLTSSKVKDWDKMEQSSAAQEEGADAGISSDED